MSPELESSSPLYRLSPQICSAPTSRSSTTHRSNLEMPTSATPRDCPQLPGNEAIYLEDSLDFDQTPLDRLHRTDTPPSPKFGMANTAPCTPTSTYQLITPPLSSTSSTASTSSIITAASIISTATVTTTATTVSTISSRQPNSSTEPQGLVRRFSNRAKNLRVNRRNGSVPPSRGNNMVGSSLSRNNSVRSGSPHPGRLTGRDTYCPSEPDVSVASDGESIISSSSSSFHGVYPRTLVTSSKMYKMSKKGTKKPVTFFANPESGTITYIDAKNKNHSISIDNLEQVRTGPETDQYCAEFNAPASDADLWLTLIFSAPEKNVRTKLLHMVAFHPSEVHAWSSTLNSIMRFREQGVISLMSFSDDAIAEIWRHEAAVQAPGTWDLLKVALPFDTLLKICRYIHLYASEHQLLLRFQMANNMARNVLTFIEFKTVLSVLHRQSGVHQIFAQITPSPTVGMTRSEFLNFLRNTQREDVDGNTEYYSEVFEKFSIGFESSARFTADSMYNYLRSKQYSSPLKKPRAQVYDQPMNRYFISSSHNTYLLGRQIAGSSSVEGYITALIGGCRCVEIDCWDGPNGEPQVLHGRTLTSSVTFESCITGINKWAFYASEYPLWISLEVHTNPIQQARMVEIMKNIFGPRLVTEPLDHSSKVLPSPEELKGRILIKVKKPIVKDDSKQNFQSQPFDSIIPSRRRGNSLTSTSPARPTPEITMPLSMPPSPVLRPFCRSKTLPIRAAEMIYLCCDSDAVNENNSENRTTNVLGDLGVYCTGVKFRGFESPEARTFNHIFSFKEDSFEKNTKTKELKRALEFHNRLYLMRVYPSQFRINSKNFDPLTYWRRGVQMAALNWQTFDLGMRLNRAMFSGNGDNSGYVLKPAGLRHGEMSSPPLPYNSHKRKDFSMDITIVSAHQLIRPNNIRAMHPYIEIEVFHTSADRYKTNADTSIPEEMTSSQVYRTRIVNDNGYNPYFHQMFNINITTRYEELVFLQFSVKLSHDGNTCSSKDQTIAVYMAKAMNLAAGYRILPLWDHKGAQYLFSNLLCKFHTNYIRPITLITSKVQNTEALQKLRGISNFSQVFSGNDSNKNSAANSTANSTATSPKLTTEKDPLPPYPMDMDPERIPLLAWSDTLSLASLNESKSTLS